MHNFVQITASHIACVVVRYRQSRGGQAQAPNMKGRSNMSDKGYYNERLEDNKMYKFIFSFCIPRVFDDFLIATGIKKYDHTSAIHTALLYEYVAARCNENGCSLAIYIDTMRRVNQYALQKSREGDGGE